MCRGKEKQGMSAPAALERAAWAGNTRRMAVGKDLLREKWSPAERTGCLLLNPRLPGPVRERVLTAEFPDLARHAWLATSGTGGRMKLVALSHDALEASALAVNKHLSADKHDVWINPLPLFHVGGLGMMVRAQLSGARHATFEQPWKPRDFTRAAETAGATLSALVPAQVHDLVLARCRAPRSLRAAVVGGGALTPKLHDQAAALGWPLLPSYGLTEAASQVATAHPGEPCTGWLPLLDHLEARVDDDSVLELRGASLLTGWMLFEADGSCRWEDPKRAGWYRTGDRAAFRGRELRVLGRVDDLVKIRGELVDVAALECALQARVTGGRVAIYRVSSARNGAVLRVVAENADALRQARALRDEIFPPYARPEEFAEGPVEATALGKTVRRPR
jgi:O-succinylbenzoic acid--CoA ligase